MERTPAGAGGTGHMTQHGAPDKTPATDEGWTVTAAALQQLPAAAPPVHRLRRSWNKATPLSSLCVLHSAWTYLQQAEERWRRSEM